MSETKRSNSEFSMTRPRVVASSPSSAPDRVNRVNSGPRRSVARELEILDYQPMDAKDGDPYNSTGRGARIGKATRIISAKTSA